MLEGAKVILRPIKIDDWEKTIEWRNNLFIKSSTLAHPFPITEEIERNWYTEKLNSKDNSFIPFTIMMKADSEIIGFISLNNINYISRIAFFSIVIGDKKNIGQGFGKEAILLLFDYAFNYLNLNKICCHVREDHPAQKTYQEIGGVIEGTLRQHFFTGGEYINVNLMAWFRKQTG